MFSAKMRQKSLAIAYGTTEEFALDTACLVMCPPEAWLQPINVFGSLSTPGTTSMCQALDYVFGENTATRELCAFFHQFQQFRFAFLADHCRVA
jgi:hypothetical protein